MYYSFSKIGSIGHKEFCFKQSYFTCIWIKKSLFCSDQTKGSNAPSLMCEVQTLKLKFLLRDSVNKMK